VNHSLTYRSLSLIFHSSEAQKGPSKSELKKQAKAAEKERKAAEKAAKQKEQEDMKAAAEVVSLLAFACYPFEISFSSG
jgi:hypothetical protein